MKVKQISLFVENKPGGLNKPCQCLAEAGISISTLTLADTKNFGILRLLIKDWERANALLEKNGFITKLVDVVAIEIDHKSGSLEKVLQVFTKNEINVEYLYAFPAPVNGKAVIIFCFDNPDTALQKLQSVSDLVIVDQESLFKE